MVKEVNTYIEETNERLSADEKTVFGVKKNKMFVFYNLEHFSRDNREFMLKALINGMINEYHLSYTVEFVESDKNKLVVQQKRKRSNPAKLRLTQIKANRMLINILSSGLTSPKI